MFPELADLIRASRPFLGLISKAKASKLVRGLVDMFLDMEAGTGIEVQLCKVSALDQRRCLIFLSCLILPLFLSTL